MIMNITGKRGQIFSAYLILITLVLTLTSILIFLSVNSKSIDSLVMPYEVLEVRDDLRIFEMQEEMILRDIDLENAEENFCEVLMSDEDYYGFLFEDLYYKNRGDWSFDFSSRLKFCRDVYDISFENDELVFVRKELGKRKFLFPVDRGKVSFMVEFEYFYERQDLFSSEDLE